MNEWQDMVLVVNGHLARQEALAGGMLSSRRTIPTQILLDRSSFYPFCSLLSARSSLVFLALFPKLCFEGALLGA